MISGITENSSQDFLLTILLADIQYIAEATEPMANAITRAPVISREIMKADENKTMDLTSKADANFRLICIFDPVLQL
jgi:hypothetical protein